ncbi:MAG TPA: Gldg family protein [Myxococcota bacterium]|jgi:ABC-type uncharacterized transport system involved in gliding motility auxiliary subunit|nr:Gldg family protein [Myxococcota bacterium]
MRSLLAPLGVVALVFALLSALLLAASGEFGGEVVWVYGNLAVGVVLLAAGLAANWSTWRERMRSGEARRAGKYGTSALLSTALAIAILGLLAFLAQRHPVRFDWSEAKVHSLSEQTRNVLAGLQQDVTVTALVPTLETAPVRDLLERYAYESPRFLVAYADPNARPDLVEKYKLQPEQLGNGVVHIEIGGNAVDVTELSENKLTNALVKLTRTGQKKVYVLQGHGERPAEGEPAKGADGVAEALDALQNENYVIAPLLLAQKGAVPDDADVVLSIGDDKPLLPDEQKALEAYLARGGAFFVAIDPGSASGLEPELAKWGVAVGNDVVVDRVLAVFNRATSPFSAEYGKHPISERLREKTLFHMVRSVQPNEAGKKLFTELVLTSRESWAERDLARFYKEGVAERGAADLAGPVPVAVAGTPAGFPTATEKKEGEKSATPRLVVFGDSDFLTNEMFSAGSNRDLFVNSVNWLLGDVEAISIRPNQSRASRLRQLSGEEFLRIRFLSLFVLPELIALAGVYAWWSRRRAPGR